MISRRHFVAGLVAGALATTLPLPAQPVQEPDEWDDFIARVRARVIEITQRENRAPRSMFIEAPRVSEDGTHYTRRVNLQIDAGGSLLDKINFQWNEYYMSRCQWNRDGGPV